MPITFCYYCNTPLNRENLSEDRKGLVCPKCEKTTMFEAGDHAKYGIKPPDEKTSPSS